MISSLFNYVFIPLVILLIFSYRTGFDSKKVVALSFFSILPDSIFLPHRAAFHNIFILIIPLLLFILIRSRKYIFNISSPGVRTNIFSVIWFYLASYLVLDIFSGGTSLFYPALSCVFFINAELRFDQRIFVPALGYGIQ